MPKPGYNEKPMAGDGIPQATDDQRASPISYAPLGWSIGLSLVVLVVIAAFTFEPEQFGDLIRNMRGWPIVAAVASLVLRTLFGGLRLRYVSRGRLGLAAGVRAQLAWDFFSNVTPSAIGGGPVTAVYVARDRQITLGESTALMLFLMLLDQLWVALTVPILLIAASMLPVFPEAIGPVGSGVFTLLFLGLLVWVVGFGYAILFKPDLFRQIADLIFRLKWLRRFRHIVAREMLPLQERAKILRSQPAKFYLIGLLLTIGVWLSRLVLPFFIIWSVFPGVDPVLALLRTLAMLLGTVVLPTPGGAGGIEGLYALLLGPLMPRALVAPTLLIWRLLAYYLFIGIGVYLTMHHVQQTIRRRRDRTEAESNGYETSTSDRTKVLAEDPGSLESKDGSP
jgi:glycosyltransferase 2 family protein